MFPCFKLSLQSPEGHIKLLTSSSQLFHFQNAGLVVGVEQLLYQPLETDPSVEVCFLIESGILDVTLTSALQEFTQDTSANCKRSCIIASCNYPYPRLIVKLHISVFLAPADYVGIDADRDFTIGTGLPGQARFCQNIAINDDNLAEGLEEFTYRLASLDSELVEVNPSRSTADIQIQDDDGKSAPIVGMHTKHSDKEFTAIHFQVFYD